MKQSTLSFYGGARAFASKALLTIREALPTATTIKSYRVTVNGPSPGRGMITRFGSARLIEGGAVEWEAGLKR